MSHHATRHSTARPLRCLPWESASARSLHGREELTMTKQTTLVAPVRVEESIVEIRGIRVILDADLATIYGVTTSRLNEQVKRNQHRFPADFMFKFSRRSPLSAQCLHRAWGDHGRQRVEHAAGNRS